MLKVVSPFDQSLIKEIPLAGKAEVEHALATAHETVSRSVQMDTCP